MQHQKVIMTALFLTAVTALFCLACLAAPDAAQPQGGAVAIWWESDTTPAGTAYGDWTEGTSSTGPQTIRQTVECGPPVSPSQMRKTSFQTPLGFLSANEYADSSNTASYQIQVPAGKQYTIVYRTKYQNYSVTETQYRMVIATGAKTVLQSKTYTLQQPICLDFSYRDDATGKIY